MMPMQQGTHHHATTRPGCSCRVGCRLAVLVLAALFAGVGCEQRVISRKAYSPQQFSGVAAGPVQPPAYSESQSDLLADIWNELGKLFKKKPKPNRNALTPEELNELRARLKRNRSGDDATTTPTSNGQDTRQ